MTSNATLRSVKRRKWQLGSFLIAPQTPTYDTPVILAFKCFSSTLVLAFKSLNTVKAKRKKQLSLFKNKLASNQVTRDLFRG